MYTNIYYSVIVSEYAKRHFITSFFRKYQTWNITFEQIENMLSRIDMLLLSSKAGRIHLCDTWYIAKCEFKIAGSNESAKTSWNRIIVYVDETNKEVDILLLYSKTNIKWDNETSWRQNEIKQNHKDISKLFSNLK